MNESNYRFFDPTEPNSETKTTDSESEFPNVSANSKFPNGDRNAGSPFPTLDEVAPEDEESLRDFLAGLTTEERNAFFTKLTERFGERLEEILALIEELNLSCAEIAQAGSQSGTETDRSDLPGAEGPALNATSFAESRERSASPLDSAVFPCSSNEPDTATAPTANEHRTDQNDAPLTAQTFSDIKVRPISDDLFYTELQALSSACEELQAYYRSMGLCPSCGGKFRGIFRRTCRQCGRPKKQTKPKSQKTKP